MSHSFFFFNDTATTEIYTLSLHDALPIFGVGRAARAGALFRNATVLEAAARVDTVVFDKTGTLTDRKSTRLNSSHSQISYAVFCLKKKKKSEYSVQYRLYGIHLIAETTHH